MKYTASRIKTWDCSRGFTTSNGKEYWIPARPITYWSFKRFKLAWYVFIGKYDALDWED